MTAREVKFSLAMSSRPDTWRPGRGGEGRAAWEVWVDWPARPGCGPAVPVLVGTSCTRRAADCWWQRGTAEQGSQSRLHLQGSSYCAGLKEPHLALLLVADDGSNLRIHLVQGTVILEHLGGCSSTGACNGLQTVAAAAAGGGREHASQHRQHAPADLPDGGAARVAAQRMEPLAARGRVCLEAARFRLLGWPAREAAIVSWTQAILLPVSICGWPRGRASDSQASGVCSRGELADCCMDKWVSQRERRDGQAVFRMVLSRGLHGAPCKWHVKPGASPLLAGLELQQFLDRQ